MEKGSTARKYGNSLDWLRDQGIAAFCHNLTVPEFPPEAYKDEDNFRMYLTDIGLLISMYGFEMKSVIMSDQFSGTSKGGIYENLIADFLIKKDRNLYYFKSKDSQREIEFILTDGNGKIVPVEVKAKRGTSHTLNAMLKKDNVAYGYKISAQNQGVEGNKKTIPFYMAMFL